MRPPARLSLRSACSYIRALIFYRRVVSAEVKQRLALRHRAQPLDAAHDDDMVAALMDRFRLAIQCGEAAAQDGCASFPCLPSDTVPPVLDRRREAHGQVALTVAQNIHGEAPGCDERVEI